MNVNPKKFFARVKRSEDSHIKTDLYITPEDYMRDRVVYKIKIYDKLGDQQKILYLSTSLAVLIISASVPALINLGVSSTIPTALSVVVTILVGVEKLFHFREHWRNYDLMAAFLRNEQLNFQAGAVEYAIKEKDFDKAFQKFVKRTQAAIDDERAETIGMRTQEAGID